MACLVHSGQQSIMVCITCPGQGRVCVECIASLHLGHTFRKLDGSSDNLGRLHCQSDTDVGRSVPLTLMQLEWVRRAIKEADDTAEQNRQKVEVQRQKIHEVVDQIANDVLERSVSEHKKVVTKLEQEEARLDQVRGFTAGERSNGKTNRFHTNETFHHLSYFEPGSVDTFVIRKMFGDFSCVSFSNQVSTSLSVGEHHQNSATELNGSSDTVPTTLSASVSSHAQVYVNNDSPACVPPSTATLARPSVTAAIVPGTQVPAFQRDPVSVSTCAPEAVSAAVVTGCPHTDSSGVVPGAGDLITFPPMQTDVLSLLSTKSSVTPRPPTVVSKTDDVFTTIPTFTHSRTSGVGFICPSASGQSWIKNIGVNKIKLTDKTGHVSQTISFKYTIGGLTMADDGRLLVCCPDERCIKQVLLPTCNVYQALSTSPLMPQFLCTTPSGELVVTMCDVMEHRVTHESIRIVAKFNDKGKEIARAQCDRQGFNIFTVPSKVCANRAGNTLAVINSTGHSASHVVLLDLELKLLLRYLGDGCIVEPEDRHIHVSDTYLVNDVNFDSCDNIVLAVASSNAVELRDPRCRPLRILMTSRSSPSSLAVQNDGRIWIGYFDGKINVLQTGMSE